MIATLFSLVAARYEPGRKNLNLRLSFVYLNRDII
jgi:hypothetical protein